MAGIADDPIVAAAARALAAGDPLGALNRVALRDDARGLALRGIAMAQLGDLDRARVLLRSAARAFGSSDVVARARCVVAEAEIAIAARDLGWSPTALGAACATLEQWGDRANAAHARQLEARRLLLMGRVDAAERALANLDAGSLPEALQAIHYLVRSGIAMRRLRARDARGALAQATRAARRAGIPMLAAEIATAARMLEAPTARLVTGDGERLLGLDEVESTLASDALVVDACRNVVCRDDTVVPLASRPVLFALARTLGEAWPVGASREALLLRAFGAKEVDESHRARLRVEIGRLRAALEPLADISATKEGFALAPHRAREVVVLARPEEERHAAVLALLADGEAWSSSALALALGASQRSVQRALDTLAKEAKVQSFGRGRARRWTTPSVPGFATAMLLPTPLAIV